MTSSTVRVLAKILKLKQSDPRMVEFQHWYFLYQGTVSIHKHGTGVDIGCIRRIHLPAVPRAMKWPWDWGWRHTEYLKHFFQKQYITTFSTKLKKTFSLGVPSALSFSFFRMKSGSCSTFFWCSFKWLLLKKKSQNEQDKKEEKKTRGSAPFVVAEGKLGVKSAIAELAAVLLQQLEHLLDQHLVSCGNCFQRLWRSLYNLHRSFFAWMEKLILLTCI